MSRGYYKTCGRKVNTTTNSSQSIQFDKLLCENSNKPSAAKSTGTIGKWGITSFTSIRSSSFTLGGHKADTVSYKRPRYDNSKSNDAYSFNQSSNPVALSLVQSKPKKFFKSRNVEEKSEISSSVSNPPPSKKYSKSTRSSVKQDSFDDSAKTEVEEINQESIENLSEDPNNSHNPPIVLRIFKGTAQLISDDSYGPKKEKEGRRRVHSSDSFEGITPKKHRHRSREIESLQNDLEDKLETLKESTETVEEPAEAEDINEIVEETVIKENIEETVMTVEVQENDGNDNDDVFEEGQRLLAETYSNIDEKVDEILDLSSTHVPFGTANSLEILPEEDNDAPLDLHIPAVKQEEIKQPPLENISEKIAEDFNSDSDSSEPIDKHVLESVKSEPDVPKPNLRPPKKGSIFKSRGEKRNAHYIHKWSDKDDVNRQNNGPERVENKIVEGEFNESLTRVTNYAKPDEFSEESEIFTSVTCSKKSKEFYTVVRNVKKAHQIQESGEFQEFNDDVEYILDALQDNNPIGTRCLSAITLASKCMVPAFRMHVRAHGTVAKFFKALHDASKDQSLGMCTATVMFVLSQDRLNMDLDRESLELMLSLLESDASSQEALGGCGFTDAQLAKTKQRVRSLCSEIKEHGHASHLNLDNITVGQLAMETLLSLTSKRAGEWFKEELRDLGGLEHIVRTIVEAASTVHPAISKWPPQLLDKMRKIDRCLRVLENVTLNNEDNSNYLVSYGGGELLDTVLRIFKTCGTQVIFYPSLSSKDKESIGAVLVDTLIATLKILINVTHDFNNQACGSEITGQKPGLIDSSLHVLLIVPDYVPEDQKFDLTFMCLILLINLVEHSENNRRLLIEAQAPSKSEMIFERAETAVSALVTLFVQQEELAKHVEKKTDAILDGEEKPKEQAKSHEEFIEETVALLLQKAGKHMEHTFVAAYVATLLGYLTINNKEYEAIIRSYLPNNNYLTMLSVLQTFYKFMTLTAATSSAGSRGIKATEMLIKHLTNLDVKPGSPQ